MPLSASQQVMRVVDGRHSGLLCEVLSLEPKEEGRSGGELLLLLVWLLWGVKKSAY